MRPILFQLIIGLGLVTLFSCSQEDAIEPTEKFVKIYNNEEFAITYSPIDIKQVEDGTYIVLSNANQNDTYLLRLDEAGEYLSDTLITSPYSNPLSELFEIDGSYHFFCMDNVSLSTHVLRVNISDSSQVPEIVQSFPSIQYPLHASQTPDGGFIVQSYDRDAESTVLTKLGAGFNQTWSAEYEVLEDVEPSIIAKFAGTSQKSLPFFTGSTEDGSTYFFNGFYNFSFSMLFVNAGNGDLIGTLNGLREETGISAAMHITGNEYALSRFSFDDNFILPSSTVTPQNNTFSGEIGGNEFPEMLPEAKVIIKRLDINGRNTIVFGTETKSKQIALYIYDATDLSLISAKYFGSSNPYEFGNFSLTADGGIAVLGKTFVAGRFPRIALFKLSEAELNEIVQ